MSPITGAKSIFLAAVEIADRDERARYVHQACHERPALLAEVERLLAARERAEDGPFSLLVRNMNPLADVDTRGDVGLLATTHMSSGPAPAVIGRYRVLGEIGRGGMGTVYRAEQLEPIQRIVALKVINPGMDSREVIARFEAERQTLAMMDHPNIARVLDAGTTPQDRPYFVMEFVEGAAPITHYCAARELGLKERLALFVDTCRAVRHAHQKGVIHRDLKPSNVLVSECDGTPVVKIIDFGVAKALSHNDADVTAVTRFEALIGTPLYMSPEQADPAARSVDARSDVYSLGVLLYELLTGTTPMEREALASVGIERARRLICESDPPRPSERLRTMRAACDSTAQGQWPLRKGAASSLRGDLDWIAMKALEKEPHRRYDSPLALAQDVERYLQHEPIEAKPPSSFNAFAKWTRRHVALVWSLLIALMTLSLALAVSTLAITASRDALEQERRRAEDDRRVAINQRNEARENLYLAEMVIGQSHVQQGNPGGLYGDLMRYLPIGGEVDLRDWEWYYLLSKCRPEVRSVRTFYAPRFAAWSPDGDLIGIAGKIWDVQSGRFLRSFDLSSILKYRVAWSPDGSKFAWCMAASANRVTIWDRTSNKLRHLQHFDSVWDVTWSPDGSRVVTGALDDKLRLWNVARQAIEWSVPTTHHPMSVAWNPRGDLLAVGYAYGGGFQVWDLHERKAVCTLPSTSGCVDVCWSPDGKQLAMCTDTGWRLLDAGSWTVAFEADLLRAGNAIAYSPDGALIAVAHGDSISVFHVAEQRQLVQLVGHRHPVQSISWAPDSRRLVSAGAEAKLWNLDDLRADEVVRADGPVTSLQWLDDSKTVVALDAKQSTAEYFELDGATRKREGLPNMGEGAEISADRTHAAVYREHSASIDVYAMETAQVIASIPVPADRELASFTLSDDGSQLVVQSMFDETLMLDVWRVGDDRLLSTCTLPRSRVDESKIKKAKTLTLKKVTWNPQGTMFAAIGRGDPGEDGTFFYADHLFIFDAVRGKRLHKRVAPGFKVPMTCLAWSDEGNRVAVGTTTGLLEAIDARSGAVLFSTKVHREAVSACSWHPDGRRLAITTHDGHIKIVSARRGKPLLSFQRSQAELVCVAWSGDGRRLAAAEHAGQIYLWDAAKGYEFASDPSRVGELAWAYHYQAQQASGEDRLAYLGECLRLAPDELGFWLLRGDVRARLGDFEGAAREFAKATRPKFEHSFNAAWWKALALLGAGRMGEYHACCAELAEAFAGDEDIATLSKVAWLLVLAEGSPIDATRATNMGRIALAEDQDFLPNHLLVAAAQFREGKFSEADTRLRDLAPKFESYGDEESHYGLICTTYLRAMTRQALGHEAQARRLLSEANELANVFSAPEPERDWRQVVVVKALHDEANAKMSPR